MEEVKLQQVNRRHHKNEYIKGKLLDSNWRRVWHVCRRYQREVKKYKNSVQ